ncbi:Cl- channel, voltage gated [Candidatus Koribacter versatilis Ellin345]|uniref:Cl-channel, voltage gated n=1 Tax=Koribacter versatilis (strain Ellin345) TaxID=204669 RepID=Q1IME9_KORVE|nr:chloride channel protein [Candidatus Koribacter versatilis]ABF41951.1 Cl- channel, voltage gated [Candidatus Koribacter versatilis Ellin345]
MTRHPATLNPAGQLAAESSEFRIHLVSFLAAIIGTAAGFVAWLLYHLIGFFTNVAFYHTISFTFHSPRNHQLGLWVILVPVVGGLIVGVMAKYGSSKIRGHGIPEAMEAVLVNRSRIEPKVAILKPLSAAIAIGTGGPFGAEGPIIQTGGAIGSLIGQVIQTTASERKVLLGCGAAAGMAATFSTPIAAVILAIELILFEFKARSFIPLVIASTIATSLHFVLMGRGPMFEVGAIDFGIPRVLPWYLLLGAICGFSAVGFSKLLYWVEDQFEKLPIDWMWWPAIGCVVLGVVGYFVPRVLGVGYDTISDILNTHLVFKVLLAVMIFKALVLLVTIGSGTSGGLLAPMFMASAAMGSAVAMIINHFIPGAGISPAAFALVAMGAVFGAASRATFAFIIFAFEITRDYNSILPLMLVAVIADGIALAFSENSIMTEKLARRGLKIHSEFEPDILRQMTVSQAMVTEPPRVPETMLVREMAERLAQHDPILSRHQGVLIVDDAGKLKGLITRGDLLRAMESEDAGTQTVLQAGTTSLLTAYEDELLFHAASRMLRAGVGRLPVVDRKDPTKILGYLGRAGVLSARLRQIEEEQVREGGWASAKRNPKAAGEITPVK